MNIGHFGAVSAAFTMLACTSVFAQQGDGTEVQLITNVFKPNKLPATSDRIGQLKVPEGFSIEPFAQGLGNSRIGEPNPSAS